MRNTRKCERILHAFMALQAPLAVPSLSPPCQTSLRHPRLPLNPSCPKQTRRLSTSRTPHASSSSKQVRPPTQSSPRARPKLTFTPLVLASSAPVRLETDTSGRFGLDPGPAWEQRARPRRRDPQEAAQGRRQGTAADPRGGAVQGGQGGRLDLDAGSVILCGGERSAGS